MEAKQIVQQLRDLGMTQQAIARSAGMSQAAISYIQAGKRTEVMPANLASLKSVLRHQKKLKANRDRAAAKRGAAGTPAANA